MIIRSLVSSSLVCVFLMTAAASSRAGDPEAVRQPDERTASAAAQRIHDDHPPPRPPRREEPTVLQITGDLLFSRPVSAVHLVVGVVFLPLALPAGIVFGDAGWALDICLWEPAEYLFERPIGEI